MDTDGLHQNWMISFSRDHMGRQDFTQCLKIAQKDLEWHLLKESQGNE